MNTSGTGYIGGADDVQAHGSCCRHMIGDVVTNGIINAPTSEPVLQKKVLGSRLAGKMKGAHLK